MGYAQEDHDDHADEHEEDEGHDDHADEHEEDEGPSMTCECKCNPRAISTVHIHPRSALCVRVKMKLTAAPVADW